MFEKPQGCSSSCQISFIEDENLRPRPDAIYYYWAIDKDGNTIAGTATSFLEAVKNVRSFVQED